MTRQEYFPQWAHGRSFPFRVPVQKEQFLSDSPPGESPTFLRIEASVIVILLFAALFFGGYRGVTSAWNAFAPSLPSVASQPPLPITPPLKEGDVVEMDEIVPIPFVGWNVPTGRKQKMRVVYTSHHDPSLVEFSP